MYYVETKESLKKYVKKKSIPFLRKVVFATIC